MGAYLLDSLQATKVIRFLGLEEGSTGGGTNKGDEDNDVQMKNETPLQEIAALLADIRADLVS